MELSQYSIFKNKKKKFLSVSLHCFKCKSVKLLSVVVLRIEQFDYTFARFV